MKKFFVVLLLFGLYACQNKQEYNPVVVETKYYQINSHFWTNFHHFLYQKAKGAQEKYALESGLKLLNTKEPEILNKLPEDQKAVLDEAVTYYRDSVIQYSLFQLSPIRVKFQEMTLGETMPDSFHTKRFAEVVNSAAKVYEENLWGYHNKLNREVIDHSIELIKKCEPDVLHKIEELSGDTLPDGLIRIDVTVYANWAGAYTPNRPEMTIHLSSLDESAKSSIFIETVFHEASHNVYTRESPFRARIYFMSEEMGIEFPADLWHAALFYLAGKATQEKLAEYGIDHKMVMDEKNIFERYNTGSFRSTLDKYYVGEIDMEQTIREFLEGIEKS